MNKKYLILIFMSLFGFCTQCYYFDNKTKFNFTITITNQKEYNIPAYGCIYICEQKENTLITNLINGGELELNINNQRQKIKLDKRQEINNETLAQFVFTQEGSKLVLKISNPKMISGNCLSWDSDSPAFIGECELNQLSENQEKEQNSNFFGFNKKFGYSLAGVGTIIFGYWAYNKYFDNKKEEKNMQ